MNITNCITWGMNSRSVGSHSSETISPHRRDDDDHHHPTMARTLIKESSAYKPVPNRKMLEAIATVLN
jgi:hypothetical protein